MLDSTSLPLGVEAEARHPRRPGHHAAAGRHPHVLHRRGGGGRIARPGAVSAWGGPWRPSAASATSRPGRSSRRCTREIEGFCRHQPQRDDITVVIVKVLEENNGAPTENGNQQDG